MKAGAERGSIEKLLRLGMIVSTLLMLASLFGTTARESTRTVAVPLFSLFTLAKAREPGEVAELVAAVGILVLAATPVIRVLALAWIWGRERDRRFMWVALTVTAILGFAVLSGRGG